jgi:NAD(P)-dependent dehydrogenase (short-subunit alcohol dehydrogenase family)
MTFANYPSLKRRVVFISGGATGIGADIVSTFVRNGSRVAFIDAQREAGEAPARTLAQNWRGAAVHRGGCHRHFGFARCDLADLRNARPRRRARQ